MPQTPTVHILLATYNGGRFIAEQLASIERQSYTDWTLTVSDDGSSDDTLEVVNTFAQRVSRPVTVLQGPRKGSTLNFCHLIAQVPAGQAQDLFAFCDQDDVWLDNKLERAVQWHSQCQGTNALLYCGRTKFVNERLQTIGLSPSIRRSPSFGNALVQNIASGNTMVFSQAVLLAQKKVQPQHSVWHDWTTYLVATAIDGIVWFDDEPCLLYRQHTTNVIGSNDGLSAQIKRLAPLFKGRFKQWTDANVGAVHDLDNLTCEPQVHICQKFQAARSKSLALSRIITWQKTNVRRQTFRSNLTLVIALLLNRI